MSAPDRSAASDPLSRESGLALIKDAQRWERAYCESRDALAVAQEQIERQAAHISKLRDACYRYDLALEKIAAGPRPDGTYNLSREACEQIAKEALRRD